MKIGIEYDLKTLMRMKKVELVAMAEAETVDLSVFDNPTKEVIATAILAEFERREFEKAVESTPGLTGHVFPAPLEDQLEDVPPEPAESVRIRRIKEQNP
ncbi:MAG: hypothetical protein ACXAB4_00725 [Candidatus Hodarchaeales archaeon]|jgi:hypothetical protein